MKNRWKLNDIQADAILNMRLRSLRKLEEVAIKKEIASLKKIDSSTFLDRRIDRYEKMGVYTES